jgi:hypothetical protein
VRVYLRGESDCVTEVMVCGRAPIGAVMMRPALDSDCGCVVEVHSFSFEKRSVLLSRLYKVFGASGCCVVGCKRRGRRTVEYSFDVELRAVLDLYCGLAQAGLELTEVSHRTLTELCMLRTHERALRAGVRLVSLRLTISFVEMRSSAEEAVLLQAASA